MIVKRITGVSSFTNNIQEYLKKNAVFVLLWLQASYSEFLFGHNFVIASTQHNFDKATILYFKNFGYTSVNLWKYAFSVNSWRYENTLVTEEVTGAAENQWS